MRLLELNNRSEWLVLRFKQINTKGLPVDHIDISKFDYEPESGKVYRNTPNGKVESGTVTTSGPKRNKKYLRARINGTRVYLHRLAWRLFYGQWPDGEIDHINGNGMDNRIENLRVVDRSQNRMNCRVLKRNTTGQAGVRKRGSKWVAQIMLRGKYIYLGSFDDFESARKVRVEEQIRLGFSPDHGSDRLGESTSHRSLNDKE